MAQVGEYTLGETIGRGAFSKVKRCLHRPTGKDYVAKIVPKTNKDVEFEIRVEIGILRRVKHPNVVQLIEILESPRNYYIILEAVDGGDLCDLVMDRRGGLGETEARRLFKQLHAGVTACHSVGVAHRDLKPENLLLTREGQVKISDFGLSRLHKESNGVAIPSEYSQTLTGTLAYVAPEVLLGPYDAFLADVWSMGCILYVMLTCKFPFGAAADRELEEKIKRGDYVPVPDEISGPARDLIEKLMQRDPAQRMTLKEIESHPFMHESEEALEGELNELSLADPNASNSFPAVDDPLGDSSPKCRRRSLCSPTS